MRESYPDRGLPLLVGGGLTACASNGPVAAGLVYTVGGSLQGRAKISCKHRKRTVQPNVPV